MTARFAVRRIADCPPAIAPEYTAQLLRGFEQTGLETHVRAPLPGFALGRRVRLRFGMHVDDTGAQRDRTVIRFRWWADTPWLPDLAGSLHFRIESPDRTLLILEGRYTPPFGPAGMLFDMLAGRQIARATAREVLARIAAGLAEGEHAFRSRYELRA
jgi:hypothetical protein